MMPMQAKGLNGNQVKLIAIIAMTIDHLAWTFFPGTPSDWYVCALHVIGRLTAPIMWFFIAEGCFHTRDIRKYAGRLFLFAIISHFAYCFAHARSPIPFQSGLFDQTSVMWPLALSVVLVWVHKSAEAGRLPKWVKYPVIVIACVLAFPADWSCAALLAPYFMYLHRGNGSRQAADIVIWSAVYASLFAASGNLLYAAIQMCTFLSVPVLMAYNGQRGKWKGMKWFFYVYYPAHLMIMGVLRVLFVGA